VAGRPLVRSQARPSGSGAESRKGEPVRELEQLTANIRRDIDLEYMHRAKAFLKRGADTGSPFFLYFNHSMMHLPTVPRVEFKGKSGRGDFADSLLELDSDFGDLLDYLSLPAFLGFGTYRKTSNELSGKPETRTSHSGRCAAGIRAETREARRRAR
jgi:hypothetical protein